MVFRRLGNDGRKPALFLLLIIWATTGLPVQGAQDGSEARFAIRSFSIGGNSVLSEKELARVLQPFAGEKKTAEDVESARDRLEQHYHEKGYPTVLVNIPEQTVDNGIIHLDVIESRIRKVRVAGNRYHTMEMIKERLPSIGPGKILYLPKVRKELARINRIPDLKVAPILVPGRELGSVDVELKVEDQLPLHGSLELNNRSPHGTTDTRLNAMIRYDNLWQKEHSLALLFVVSPEDSEDVRVFSGSYVLPAPWVEDDLLSFFYINSDSESTAVEGDLIRGKGEIFAGRYIRPLQPYGSFEHNFTVGVDHKIFIERQIGQEEKPIEYTPFLMMYAASLPDRTGITQISASVNWLFREVFSDGSSSFSDLRPGARGNYIYGTLGIERTQKLPLKLGLFAKLDGQVADQPLISNEQYAAGGVNSVRGYKESEELGDDAVHGTMEISAPSVAQHIGLTGKWRLVPYLFYDFAYLWVKAPLPDQKDHFWLQGAGFGLRSGYGDNWEAKFDLGIALEDTEKEISGIGEEFQTEAGDMRPYFQVKYQF